MLFNYFNDFQITSIWPRTLPSTGSVVFITGRNIPKNLSCRVGTVENPAIYLQNGIQCIIPATTQVSIQFTTNNQNYISFSEITSLSTYSNSVLSSISQQAGNINTYIQFSATNLVNNNFFTVKINIQAYWRFLSSNTLVIQIPSIVSGTYSLEVSNNSQDFLKLSNIIISDLMQVISVTPVLASIKGGTLFSINVINAVNSSLLTCMFVMDFEVSLNLYRSYIVSATYYNSTFMTCRSPSFPYPGKGYLRGSNDNQTFSSSNVSISLIDTCKDRVQCIGNQVSACPVGSFCLEKY